MPHPTRNPKLKTIFVRVVGRWMMLINRRRNTQHTVHFRVTISAFGENKYFVNLRIASDSTLLPLSPKPVTIVVVESSMSFDFTAWMHQATRIIWNERISSSVPARHHNLNLIQEPVENSKWTHRRVEDILHTILIAPESDLTVFYSSVVCTERKRMSIECGRDRIELNKITRAFLCDTNNEIESVRYEVYTLTEFDVFSSLSFMRSPKLHSRTQKWIQQAMQAQFSSLLLWILSCRCRKGKTIHRNAHVICARRTKGKWYWWMETEEFSDQF